MFEIVENQPIEFGGLEWQTSEQDTVFTAYKKDTGSMSVALIGSDWWWMVKFNFFTSETVKTEASGFVDSREQAMQTCMGAKGKFLSAIARLDAEFKEAA